MKILATTDWHIGNSFHGYDRTDEHQHFFKWLLDTLRTEQPDAMLVAGDIFDNGNPSALAQSLYYDFLAEATAQNPGMQIIIIAGNHDSAARLEAPNAFLQRHHVKIHGLVKRRYKDNSDTQSLNHCEAEDIGQSSEQNTSRGGYRNNDRCVDYDALTEFIYPRNAILKNEKNTAERVTVFAVPYLRDGDYPYGMNYASGVPLFLRNGIAEINSHRPQNEALILLAHLYANGSEIADNSSERIVVGGAECVDISTLADDVTLTWLGHIHKHQTIDGLNTMRYIGSALPMSFTERNYKHGVEVVEISNGVCTDKPRFVVYEPLHPLISIPVDNIRTILQWIKNYEDKPATINNSGLSQTPYLEVNVLLEEADPSVNKQIEDALEGKNLRLCRVVPTYKHVIAEVDDDIQLSSAEDLLNLDPMAVIRQGFERKNGFAMNDELVALAQKAIDAVKMATS